MEAIKYYVQGAFQGVRLTPEVIEQQEEIIADLTAKVADLVAEGKSQEEALGVAIASLGDLSPLVAEFASADDAEQVVPTALVFTRRLDLHVVAISVAIGAAVMVASTVLGAWSGLIDPAAGFSLLAVLAAGLWWVRTMYTRGEESPDAVESRVLSRRSEFRRALLIWVGSAVVVTFINAVSGAYFWSWPIWVAGGTWALTFKVEEWLMRRGWFHVPAQPDTADV